MTVALLTARELVAELARLEVCTRSADAVRQWIREEPPCPIAQAAQQGAPHRYRLGDVMAWLRARAERERAKGFAPADGVSIIDRIDAALSRLMASPAATVPQPVPVALAPPRAASTQTGSGLPLFDAPQTTPQQGAEVSPAKRSDGFTGDEVDSSTSNDMLLKVLAGRDPRNWKAAEEALQIRQERLVAAGQLLPLADQKRLIESLVVLVRTQIEQLDSRIAANVPDQSTYLERRQIGRQIGEDILNALARATVTAGG